MTVFFRTPYNYDVKAVSIETGSSCPGVSMTDQSQAADADINVIVRRFGLTGVMPPLHRVPEYGDFAGISDYRTALEAVQAAAEHFNAMPAEVRAEFFNDPQVFLEFCHDSKNLPRMRELGLAIPEKVVDNTLADVVKAIDRIVPRGTGGSDGSGVKES